ncbi:MAG: ComEC/Rec2 family competence protein, partial [Candidatus Gallimonas sp.]
IIRYLKGLAPTAVSLLVTHADADHYGGMTELLQCFGADALYLPVLGEDAAEYRAILRAAEEIGCPTQTVTRYDVIARPSGAYLNCISPYSAGETDHNESSATLFFSYEGVNAVFCGDVSAEREGKLAREYALDETLFDRGEYVVRLDETDILKTAHHGSGGSSSEEWLGLLGAETAIISCGRGNFYGHPAGSALKRLSESGCEIYRTDELGDVVIVVADGKYTVYTDYTE